MSDIFIQAGRRLDIRNFTGADGERFPGLTISERPEKLAEYGIECIQEPPPPDDYTPETHDRIETDEAPYVAWPRKPQARIDADYNDRIDDRIRAIEIATGMDAAHRAESLADPARADHVLAQEVQAQVDALEGQKR